MKNLEGVNRFRLLLVFAVSVGLPGPAKAYLGPLPADPDRLWYTIVAQSPIQSAADFEVRTLFAVPKDWGKKEPPGDVHVDIRHADSLALAASIPVKPFYWHEFGLQSQHATHFSRILRDRLAELEPGEYQVAIVNGNERMSNVTPLVIDPDFDQDHEPVLRLLTLEPPPYRDLPILVVQTNGTTKMSIKFKADHVSYPRIVVDGKPHKRTIMVGSGPNPEIRPGDRWLHFIEIDGFLSPRVERGVTHEYEITVSNCDPVTIVAGPESPLGDAWDAAVQRETESR